MSNKEIFYLTEYNWRVGTLIKENRKTYTIEWINYSNYLRPYERITQKFSKEKCAFPDELVCIVWETWKGVNGRGGYRVEKELYPNERIPANQVARQHTMYSPNGGKTGRVTESSYGVL